MCGTSATASWIVGRIGLTQKQQLFGSVSKLILEIYKKVTFSHLSTFLMGVHLRRLVGGRFGECNTSNGSKSKGRLSVTQAILYWPLMDTKWRTQTFSL